ncbi:MAG TPA: DUF2255 family protein [Terrimicrobium sp.]
MNRSDRAEDKPFCEDGFTYGTPTWIWSVVVGEALYVRAYSGQRSRWYQAAVRQKAGRITVASMRREVLFESVNGPINELVDDAYCAKYNAVPISAQCSAHALAP